MSQFCSACGKGALTINLRSKSMRATKSTQRVNLQRRSIDGKRVKICTRCLKTRSTKPEAVSIGTRTVRLPKRRTKQRA
ncbi:50S ribosomal protein L28 [Candidatus Uhrbacteria bacterium]|nr:50S ribosomal protein L28 [Candidatus Uhrbacteria bacterium]